MEVHWGSFQVSNVRESLTKKVSSKETRLLVLRRRDLPLYVGRRGIASILGSRGRRLFVSSVHRHFADQ